jgi:hypothetical protein
MNPEELVKLVADTATVNPELASDARAMAEKLNEQTVPAEEAAARQEARIRAEVEKPVPLWQAMGWPHPFTAGDVERSMGGKS